MSCSDMFIWKAVSDVCNGMAFFDEAGNTIYDLTSGCPSLLFTPLDQLLLPAKPLQGALAGFYGLGCCMRQYKMCRHLLQHGKVQNSNESHA